MRPALILTGGDGTERRILAELDDKPWAAEAGTSWRATFAVEGDLAETTAIELSVAPDIIVLLRGVGIDGTLRRAERERGPVPANAPAAPRVVAGPSRPRPAAATRAADLDRVTTQLTAARDALERERERRAEAEQGLERQRQETRRLSAELGRARAELELARTAEQEARETSALLDAARRDNHAARERYEALSAEHERAVGAQARLQSELRSREEELARARDELRGAEQQRAEARERSRSDDDGSPTAIHHPVHPAAPVRAARPVNPSLHGSSWLVRFIALLVIAAFVLAIYLVLHSTILH